MTTRPVLTIDRLNLRLPHGFERRANAIARETARQLAKLPQVQGGLLDSLSVPNVAVFGGETNGVIAKRIALSLHGQVGNKTGREPSR